MPVRVPAAGADPDSCRGAGGGTGVAPVAVCAPNAFKGSTTAAAAARALARGVVDAGWDARQVPVADGGDGTLEVLLASAAASARVEVVTVTGPLGRRRRARLGWLSSTVAVVEMAEAAGLRLLPPGRRDPLGATSRGVGELITAALDGGAERVIVGVGGSASTDSGAGLLVALGARLGDARGRPVDPGGGSLGDIVDVDLSGVDARLRRVAVDVAVDVRSPLCGPAGAAAVFAPQKGAAPAEVELLEAGLRHFAPLLERSAALPGLAEAPGTGAAGGAAFALAALGARLVGGAALVCDLAGLDSAIHAASLVITGEGRLDDQTTAGKAPAEVAARAARARVPCIAVCGSVTGGEELFTATLALDRLGTEPLRHTRALLRTAAARAVSLVAVGP